MLYCGCTAPCVLHLICSQCTHFPCDGFPSVDSQVGWSPSARTKDTLLGYPYTWGALAAIAISAVLGLLVSLSTFLVIGATSSLTYNVVCTAQVHGYIIALIINLISSHCALGHTRQPMCMCRWTHLFHPYSRAIAWMCRSVISRL